ncbi:restriction endonuclease subunit S [Bacillus thuringiensis]|uniref:restriction endonuclease subunit S n=1 Tax=Bacillus thuringiensis TaxID=1428 RepID=UPI0037D7FDB3
MNQYKVKDLLEKVISGEWGSDALGENDVSVIRTTNFTNTGNINLEKEVVKRNIAEQKVKTKKLRPGDIIIEKSGGSPEQPVGRVVYFDIDEEEGIYLCNNFTSILRTNELVNSKYLFYYLFYQYQRKTVLKFQNKTTGIINLKLDDYLKDIDISLPSFEEQKGIVAVLDKAKSLIEKRKEALVKLEEALQSFYFTTVGTGAKNYRQWEKKKIEDLALAEKGSMRTGPFGSDLKHSEFVNEGIAVLGIDNAVNNRFSWGERRFITEEKYNQLKRYTVKPKDVIITIMGTTGRSAVVPDDIPLAITTKHLATITLNNRLALPEFISYSIHSNQYILKQIQKANKGAIMNGLNLGIIKKLEICLPPMNEQKKFLDFYLNYQLLRNSLTKSLITLENNFNSLLQRAFKGELKINAEVTA